MSSSSRIALFIDGANLYATAKALGFDIDYKRLLADFQTRGTLVRGHDLVLPPLCVIPVFPGQIRS